MNIKEKKVELIELFFDLIYVYAISKLTLLIEEPVNGTIPVSVFFRYLVACFIILQAWLYMTNYVNRYGRWNWYEYIIVAINMIATVYMSNTISASWSEISLTFTLSMLVMLLCVALLYFIQTLLGDQDPGAAKNSLKILSINCTLYFIAFLASVMGIKSIVIWIDVAAVLVGAFLPFFIRGNFNNSIISFPHLTERFELITIITFGEGVVGMTSFFDIKSFSMRPVLVFAIILLLFGFYVLQIHYLCNHMRVARSLRLMFSHYFIVISLNLITVSFKFLENSSASRMLTSILMISAILLFLISVFANSAYYHDRFSFSIKDFICTGAFAIMGSVIILFQRNNIYGFLIGVIIAVGGNFILLLKKYNKKLSL